MRFKNTHAYLKFLHLCIHISHIPSCLVIKQAVYCYLQLLYFIQERHETLLIHASQNGFIKVVDALIKRGVDLEKFDLVSWSSCLFRWFDTETIVCRQGKGCTALSWSCQAGHSDIALLLIEEGAKVDSRDKVYSLVLGKNVHSRSVLLGGSHSFILCL